jgi:hypothetical protein
MPPLPPVPEDDDVDVFGAHEGGAEDHAALDALIAGGRQSVADKSRNVGMADKSPSLAARFKKQIEEDGSWDLIRRTARSADVGAPAGPSAQDIRGQTQNPGNRRPSQHEFEYERLQPGAIPDYASILQRSWAGVLGISLEYADPEHYTADARQGLGFIASVALTPASETPKLMTYTKKFRQEIEEQMADWVEDLRVRTIFGGADTTLQNIQGTQRYQQEEVRQIRAVEKEWARGDVPFKTPGSRLGAGEEDLSQKPSGYAVLQVAFETHSPEMLNTFLHVWLSTYGTDLDYLLDLGEEERAKLAELEFELSRAQSLAGGLAGPGEQQSAQQKLVSLPPLIAAARAAKEAKWQEATSAMEIDFGPTPLRGQDGDDSYAAGFVQWTSDENFNDELLMVDNLDWSNNEPQPFLYDATDDEMGPKFDHLLDFLRRLLARVSERIRIVSERNPGVNVLFGADQPTTPLMPADREVYTFFTTTALVPREFANLELPSSFGQARMRESTVRKELFMQKLWRWNQYDNGDSHASLGALGEKLYQILEVGDEEDGALHFSDPEEAERYIQELYDDMLDREFQRLQRQEQSGASINTLAQNPEYQLTWADKLVRLAIIKRRIYPREVVNGLLKWQQRSVRAVIDAVDESDRRTQAMNKLLPYRRSARSSGDPDYRDYAWATKYYDEDDEAAFGLVGLWKECQVAQVCGWSAMGRVVVELDGGNTNSHDRPFYVKRCHGSEGFTPITAASPAT